MGGLDLEDRRLWLGGGAIAAMVIVLAAWVFAIHPKRSEIADLRSQAADVQTQNISASQQEATLEAKSKHISRYRIELSRALAALPPRNALSQFTQELSAAEKSTGVKLTNIAIGAPTPVVATEPVATPTPADTGSDNTSTDGTSEAPATASEATTAASTGPVSVAVTLTASGTTAADLAFLQTIRTGQRPALITSVQLSSGSGTAVALTAQVNVFSSPMSDAQRDTLRKLADQSK